MTGLRRPFSVSGRGLLARRRWSSERPGRATRTRCGSFPPASDGAGTSTNRSWTGGCLSQAASSPTGRRHPVLPRALNATFQRGGADDPGAAERLDERCALDVGAPRTGGSMHTDNLVPDRPVPFDHAHETHARGRAAALRILTEAVAPRHRPVPPGEGLPGPLHVSAQEPLAGRSGPGLRGGHRSGGAVSPGLPAVSSSAVSSPAASWACCMRRSSGAMTIALTGCPARSRTGSTTTLAPCR